MDVHVERNFIIPPPPSKSKEVPLTVFDLVAKGSHVTVLYAFSAPNPSNDAPLTALTAVLPHFPLLTAHLDRDPVTDRPFFVTSRGGAGALVVEDTVSTALSDHLPLAPSPDRALLHVPFEEGTRQMLKVQINRFACGGVVIALSTHHQATDGPSVSTFLQAWVDTVRGDCVPPDDFSAPYGPRALASRCPPRCDFEDRSAEFLPLSTPHRDGGSEDPQALVRVDPSEITNTLLHYTNEFVAELKAKAKNKYSTFETLSAHLWKKITVARGLLASATPTSIYVAVNGRWRVGADAIPKDFFGNVILSASTQARARDLVSGRLVDAAARVRAAARAVDQTYLQSFIDFGPCTATRIWSRRSWTRTTCCCRTSM